MLSELQAGRSCCHRTARTFALCWQPTDTSLSCLKKWSKLFEMSGSREAGGATSREPGGVTGYLECTGTITSEAENICECSAEQTSPGGCKAFALYI